MNRRTDTPENQKKFKELLRMEPHKAITLFPNLLGKEEIDLLMGKHAPLLLNTAGINLSPEQVSRIAKKEPRLTAEKHPQTAPLDVVWKFNKDAAIQYRWQELSATQLQSSLTKRAAKTMTHAWRRLTTKQAETCWMLAGRKPILTIAQTAGDSEFFEFLLQHQAYADLAILTRILPTREKPGKSENKSLFLRIFNLEDPKHQLTNLQTWKKHAAEALATWL